MTSGNDRIVFIHIPKTGGTWAVEAMKRAGVPLEGISAADHPRLRHIPRQGRFTFAFVREPLSWYASVWRWHRQTPQYHWKPVGKRLDQPFPAFLESMIRHYPSYVGWFYTRFVGVGSSSIDFVGRQESLKDDLKRALTTAGQPFDCHALDAFPAVNESSFPAPDCSRELAERLKDSENECYERFYGALPQPRRFMRGGVRSLLLRYM